MVKAVKKMALVGLLVLGAAVLAVPAGAGTLGYPTVDHASFLVEVPDSWEVTPGDEEGDYVHVNSPKGVYLAFRTIPGDEGALHAAIEDSVAFIEENYKNTQFGEPVEAKQAGLEGFYMDGSGKDEDGTPLTFRMAWLALKDGHIGELWFAAPASEKGEIAAAAKVLNSFRAP